MYLQTQDRMHIYEVTTPFSIIKKDNLFLLEVKEDRGSGDYRIVGEFNNFEMCEKVMLRLAEEKKAYAKNIFVVPSQNDAEYHPAPIEPAKVVGVIKDVD